MSHARLAPSSAARRVQCPASVTMQERYPEMPDEDREASEEGVAAHWALAEVLTGQSVDVGVIAPNGHVLDLEMVEAVDEVFEYVMARANGLPMLVEARLEIPRTHPECWGTPDLRFWKGKRLTVLDFKYGHKPVQAFENWQLLEYVSGALSEAGHNDLEVEVEMVIAQPRNYRAGGPFQSWVARAADLRQYFNILSTSAHEALGDAPKARPGPQCEYCRARHACGTLQQAAWASMDLAQSSYAVDLPPQALGLEYAHLTRAKALLDARVTGLEAQIKALAKQGKAVPGWRLEQGGGRTTWARPDAEVIALGSIMGVDLAKPPQAITPKQAVAKGLPEAALVGATQSGGGEVKLVQDDGSFTRRVFGLTGQNNAV